MNNQAVLKDMKQLPSFGKIEIKKAGSLPNWDSVSKAINENAKIEKPIQGHTVYSVYSSGGW